MTTTLVVLALLAATLVYLVMIYNNLVMLRENVKRNWSNIDVVLKQRHDELPKLVDTCREYMKYEQDTLEKVMLARSAVSNAQTKGDVPAVGAAEGMLRAGLGQLFAVVENYPDLKANDNFQHLQARITGLEDSIADRREFYNESVNNNNIRIAQLPDLIVARMLAFREADLLEFSASELADVNVGALFAGGQGSSA